MRKITLALSLVAIFTSLAEPAAAGKEGLPGRRSGGGTRFTQSRQKITIKTSNRLYTLTFASRNRVPMSLRIKAFCS
jgi:acid phosphatase class B